MLDIQFIRENPELVQEKSRQKGYDVDITKLLKVDNQRRLLMTTAEELRNERNVHAKELQKAAPTKDQIDKGRSIKGKLTKLEEELETADKQYRDLLEAVPNMPTDDVPVGASENDNQVAKAWGEPKKPSVKPKSDAELGVASDLIDKERATKVASARFAYIKGGLVELEFALIQYVLKTLADVELIKKLIDDNQLNIPAKPFVPVLPPAVANTATYEATGRLNSEEQTYKLADDDLWLNASAEHTLAPMYMNEILNQEDLPIRYLGFTTAFRREAGSYGKDTEGIFRMHQFDKLEMEVFSTPETGLDEHKLLIALQEYLLQSLELPYQVILKCTADIGKPNARGVDINTWMAAQGEYRETHTADYITDYQARRMKTRFKDEAGKTKLVHTNDATAFAMGRIIKAIIEYFQQPDGTIEVPQVLRAHVGREAL